MLAQPISMIKRLVGVLDHIKMKPRKRKFIPHKIIKRKSGEREKIVIIQMKNKDKNIIHISYPTATLKTEKEIIKEHKTRLGFTTGPKIVKIEEL